MLQVYKKCSKYYVLVYFIQSIVSQIHICKQANNTRKTGSIQPNVKADSSMVAQNHVEKNQCAQTSNGQLVYIGRPKEVTWSG